MAKTINTKIIKKKEIRLSDLTETELVMKIKELRQQITKLNLERFTGTVTNLKKTYGLRKEVARAKTILNIKKIR